MTYVGFGGMAFCVWSETSDLFHYRGKYGENIELLMLL